MLGNAGKLALALSLALGLHLPHLSNGWSTNQPPALPRLQWRPSCHSRLLTSRLPIFLPISRRVTLSLPTSNPSGSIACKACAEAWAPPNGSVSEEDYERLEAQLGYVPTNALLVASRAENGDPQVLQCYPMVASKGAAQPFPTMFWLTCPSIKAEVSRIEYQGWIQELKRRLDGDADLRSINKGCSNAYAAERWALLTEADRQFAVSRGWTQRLRDDGVSGMRDNGGGASVKCLHTHYAHFLARGRGGSIIGGWVDDILKGRLSWDTMGERSLSEGI